MPIPQLGKTSLRLHVTQRGPSGQMSFCNEQDTVQEVEQQEGGGAGRGGAGSDAPVGSTAQSTSWVQARCGGASLELVHFSCPYPPSRACLHPELWPQPCPQAGQVCRPEEEGLSTCSPGQ